MFLPEANPRLYVILCKKSRDITWMAWSLAIHLMVDGTSVDQQFNRFPLFVLVLLRRLEVFAHELQFTAAMWT